MSNGSFQLIRFTERQKMLEALQGLHDDNRVKSWNAVDGHYGLVVTGEVGTDWDWLEKLDGFQERAACSVTRTGADREQPDDIAYTYVFIDAEEESRAKVFQALDSMEETYFCAEATGDFTHIAVVGGSDFRAVNDIVENKIRTIPGVLRLKQDRIIFLDHI